MPLPRLRLRKIKLKKALRNGNYICPIDMKRVAVMLAPEETSPYPAPMNFTPQTPPPIGTKTPKRAREYGSLPRTRTCSIWKELQNIAEALTLTIVGSFFGISCGLVRVVRLRHLSPDRQGRNKAVETVFQILAVSYMGYT